MVPAPILNSEPPREFLANHVEDIFDGIAGAKAWQDRAYFRVVFVGIRFEGDSDWIKSKKQRTDSFKCIAVFRFQFSAFFALALYGLRVYAQC
jgi:hypothetical protein